MTDIKQVVEISFGHKTLGLPYSKLVVPMSMRSIYWQYFGFPASDDGSILTKDRIICALCGTQISYNKNTSNLRMHLQNKHMNELIKIEDAASPLTCRSRMLRKIKPDKTVVGVVNPRVSRNPVELLTPEVSFGDESPVSPEEAVTDDKEMVLPHAIQSPKVVRTSLTQAITNHIISDLVRPDITELLGFQKLLLSLKSPCEIPSLKLLQTDILPKQYASCKKKLQRDILELGKVDVALSFEEWSVNSSRSYLTCFIHFCNKQQTFESRVLTTVGIIPTAEAGYWETIIDNLINEWYLQVNRITAFVCALTNPIIMEALKTFNVPILPCFNFIIKDCVEKCLANNAVNFTINKVRDVITILKNHPQSFEMYYANDKEFASLATDSQITWLSTLNMLTSMKKCQPLIVTLEIELEPKMKLNLDPDDWLTISDVIDVLNPLQVTLQTLCEEKAPIVSILKPLLWQVLSVRSDIRDEDSDLKRTLKTTINEEINQRFEETDVEKLIYTAALLDPRFKKLPFNSDDEKKTYTNLIERELAGIEVEEEVVSAKKSRASGMELLLGGYQSQQDESKDTGGEYRNFYEYSSAPLDADPLKWWSKYGRKYPRVAKFAEKFWCVPACAVNFDSLEDLEQFYLKRSGLPTDLIGTLIFLHYNHSINQQSPAV